MSKEWETADGIERPDTEEELLAIRRARRSAERREPSSGKTDIIRELVGELGKMGERLGLQGDQIASLVEGTRKLTSSMTTLEGNVDSSIKLLTVSQTQTRELIKASADADAARSVSQQASLDGLLSFAEIAESREARREAREEEERQRRLAREDAEWERENRVANSKVETAEQLRKKVVLAAGAIIAALTALAVGLLTL